MIANRRRFLSRCAAGWVALAGSWTSRQRALAARRESDSVHGPIRITDIEIHDIMVDYVDWIAYPLNHYYGPTRRTIYVVRTNNGLVGLGEGEREPDRIIQKYIGTSPFDWVGDENSLPLAKAMYDLMGKAAGVPVYKLLGSTAPLLGAGGFVDRFYSSGPYGGGGRALCRAGIYLVEVSPFPLRKRFRSDGGHGEGGAFGLSHPLRFHSRGHRRPYAGSAGATVPFSHRRLLRGSSSQPQSGRLCRAAQADSAAHRHACLPAGKNLRSLSPSRRRLHNGPRQDRSGDSPGRTFCRGRSPLHGPKRGGGTSPVP